MWQAAVRGWLWGDPKPESRGWGVTVGKVLPQVGGEKCWFLRGGEKGPQKAGPPNTGSCLGREPPPENTTAGLSLGPHSPDSQQLGHGHLLDQVEDEPLQGVVVGFWQVLQDGVDGSQLLLLLWKL